MKIIVAGDGKVGNLLTEQLAKEGHDIVVIDRDSSVLRHSQEKLDVAIVVGNCASSAVQTEAGIGGADLMIAVTSSDEVNLLSALVARKLGCSHLVARVRSQEYDREMNMLKRDFGLSFTINPEKSAANEIFRLIQFPSFLKRNSFAGGRAEMVEFKVTRETGLAGKRLDQTPDILGRKALVCAVDRNNEVVIPSGSFQIQEGDKVSLTAATADLPFLLQRLGMKVQRIRKVMIVGGSSTAAYLAESLVGAGVSVTIIEQNHARCIALCESIPKATIIEGDGSVQSLLKEEGITDIDAVVTLTGMDEENLMISLFANSVGVPKTITKVNRLEYLDVLAKANIDTIVSPKLLTANEIVRYVRAVDQSREGSIDTLYNMNNGKAEALGFTVPSAGSFLNVPFTELKLQPGILIATIIRNQQVITPAGNDYMTPGDSVIVIANTEKAISNLTDIFADSEAGPA